MISVGGPVGTPATANTLVITPPGTGALGTPYVATDPTTGNGTTTGLPCIISMEFDNSTVG